MKNIYIIDEYISSQKNGIGTFLRELLFCFKYSGNNINIISFNAETDEFYIVDEKGMKKYLFPVFKYGHFLEHHKIIANFFRLYISDSEDNVFLFNHSQCADFIAILKVTLPKSTVVFTIHDFGWTGLLKRNLNEYEKVTKQYGNKEANVIPAIQVYWKEKRIYELADKVICLSSDTFNILQNLYEVPKSKISLIPNGLRIQTTIKSLIINDKKRIREQKNINDTDRILLFVRRPTIQKGVFDLIEALKLVLRKNKHIKLVTLGEENEVVKKDLVKASSDIVGSILYTGQLSKNEVMDWLSITDIGMISSYYEQCSYTAIEMMMHGLPIIASDGLGVRNMFIDGVNAKVAKIEAVQKTEQYQENPADCIMFLLKSPNFRESLGKGARKTDEGNYKIRKMRDNYKRFLDSL